MRWLGRGLSNIHRAASWFRPGPLVAEAVILLLIARLLIRFDPLRWWRASLGRVGPCPHLCGKRSNRQVVRAVIRATQRLPLEMICLPRAMAVQWMMRRRQPSALVFGTLPERGTANLRALHAWVEVDAEIIIGNDPTGTDARGLMLVQP
jgi:Transglutaminase-like superfamily